MSMAERSRSVARLVLPGLAGGTLALAALAPMPAGASAPVHITDLQNAGPNSGGTTIVIQGTGFQSGATVRIGTSVLTPTSITSTNISVVTPNISPAYGFFSVEVDNPDGGRTPEHFTFNDYEQLPTDTPQSSAQPATHDLSSDQQLDVFTRGSDNTLHHTWSTQVFPTWAPWESLGGTLTSAPTAVSWGNRNRIDVFVRGTDNALWHKWWDGASWSGWEYQGGGLSAAPSVAAKAANRLDVFIRGGDGCLYRKSWNGASWSGFSTVSSSQWNSAPGSTSQPGTGTLDVFATWTDNSVWHMSIAG
jgi:IPT/TIG domain/Repeat of unknown function (DUF346)